MIGALRRPDGARAHIATENLCNDRQIGRQRFFRRGRQDRGFQPAGMAGAVRALIVVRRAAAEAEIGTRQNRSRVSEGCSRGLIDKHQGKAGNGRKACRKLNPYLSPIAVHAFFSRTGSAGLSSPAV